MTTENVKKPLDVGQALRSLRDLALIGATALGTVAAMLEPLVKMADENDKKKGE